LWEKSDALCTPYRKWQKVLHLSAELTEGFIQAVSVQYTKADN